MVSPINKIWTLKYEITHSTQGLQVYFKLYWKQSSTRLTRVEMMKAYESLLIFQFCAASKHMFTKF